MISLRPQKRRPQGKPSPVNNGYCLEEVLCRLAEKCGLGPLARSAITPLAADGSDRRFFRLATEPATIAVLPSGQPHGRAEAVSCYTIGCHLADAGVPVPQIMGQLREERAILMEDVGDCHLQQAVSKVADERQLIHLYQQAVDGLLALQVDGRAGFDLRCCWGSRQYDFDVMVEQESGYFLRSLCHDYLALQPDIVSLQDEFVTIARQAAQLSADFLLHRDFQSRNLMVHQQKVRIIDFQGARLGPLGYDLASLLIDPYTALSVPVQEEIFSYYVQQASAKIELDPGTFRAGYLLLAIQRNLQILGAFAFLSQIKGKPFFAAFIEPALASLASLLVETAGSYPTLTSLVDECQQVHREFLSHHSEL